MLTHLHVRGFKSLRDVEVDLARLVVVFGPNAAGKSNLLESIVLLSRLVCENTLADAFDEGIRGYPAEAFTLATGGVEHLLEGDVASMELVARVGSEGSAELEYGVGIGIRPRTGELQLLSEHLSKLDKRGRPLGNPVIERVDDAGRSQLRVRRKDKQSHPHYEPVGINHTLVSNRQYAGATRYPAVDALRREMSTWRVLYLDPRDAMRRAQPPREVDDIGERGEFLVPFLHRLASTPTHERAFAAIVRALRAVVPSIEDVRTQLVPSRGEIDLQIKQDGAWMTARVVSEGTLRVLALCAMAVNPYHTGLVAFEEPENGVHPRRIEAVTRILVSAARRRQVVVTTHSPLVVAQLLRMVRAEEIPPTDIRLVTCSGGPDGTRVATFESLGDLFAEQEVAGALTSAEDAAVIQAMQERGWLDG
ncbi:ATP-binding protein [Myxococcota bacterium]|nr:ATP-binding protein [Myxococcota bacterium]